MSISEEVDKQDIKDKGQDKEFIHSAKDSLWALKQRRSLFEDSDFIWFYKKYIQSPYITASDAHATCTETNKNFILKGKVQAFRSITLAKAELNKEIELLQDKVRRHELNIHTEDEDYQPHN